MKSDLINNTGVSIEQSADGHHLQERQMQMVPICKAAWCLFVAALATAALSLAPLPALAARIGVSIPGNNLGLVGYWTFDGKDIVTNVADRSGNANIGYLGNFTSTTTGGGKIGQALKFDGVNDYATTSAEVGGLPSKTFAGWFKWNSVGLGWQMMVGEADNFDNNQSSYLTTDSNGSFQMRVYQAYAAGTASFAAAGPRPDIGRWYHVAGVIDKPNNVIKLYVDGTLYGTGDGTGMSASTFYNPVGAINIGGFGANNSYWFDGSIDDVRIYNRALSAAEIARLYNQGAGGKIAATPRAAGTKKCGTYSVQGSGSDSTNTYGTVVGEDGRCWLDRNLGATTTATAYNTESSYGYYYQWGRGNDGHQVVYPLSGVTGTGSNSDTPGHGNFISTSTSPYDWRYPQNNSLWQGVSGTNNVCPAGFRIPTGGSAGEWKVYTDAAGLTSCGASCREAFAATALRLPSVGYRDYSSGSLNNLGLDSSYWGSTVSGVYAFSLYFDSTYVGPADNFNRANAFPVRCIADESYNTGLVAHYTFDGPDMLTNVADRSGQGNSGYLSGFTATATAQVPGKAGQALKFDGVNDYVGAGDVNTLDGLTAMTVSAWVKSSAAGAWTAESHFVDKSKCDGSADGGSFEIYAASRVPRFAIYKTGGTPNYYDSGAGTTNIDDTKWHHLLGRYDGSNVSVWVDGVQENSTGAVGVTLSATAYALELGGHCNAIAPFPLNGTVDDVHIYNRALSVGEIGQLYNQGAAGKIASSPKVVASASTCTRGLSCGLVGYWTFDGADMLTNVADRSGQGNSGYLSGFTATATAQVPGKLGQAIKFDGVDDYVDISHNSIFDFGTGNFSVSMWANVSVLDGNASIITKSDNASANYWALTPYTPTAIEFKLRIAAGTPIRAQFTSWTMNAWHHVVGIRNGTVVSIYVDGVKGNDATVGAGESPDTSSDIVIAADDGTPGRFDGGKFDDVRIYNRALSASEVLQLYNQGR